MITFGQRTGSAQENEVTRFQKTSASSVRPFRSRLSREGRGVHGALARNRTTRILIPILSVPAPDQLCFSVGLGWGDFERADDPRNTGGVLNQSEVLAELHSRIALLGLEYRDGLTGK